MMRYIVLDLEWNQPRYPRETVEKPLHLTGEVIQIGAVRLNRKFRIRKELRLAVKPQYYKKVHRRVGEITGLNNEDLKKGYDFPKAMKKLLRFCGKDYVFLTWGPDDIPMLRDNLILHGLEDCLPKVYDLQVIFAKQIAGENRQFSLSLAMEMLGEGEFDAHDALNDARSTALVCRHLRMEEGLKEYPLLANEITDRPLSTAELGIRFESKQAALREVETTPFPSPCSEEYLEPQGMVPQNPSKYLAIAEGENDEKYLVRFLLRKNRDGEVRITREIFALNEAVLLFYREKARIWEEKKKAEREKEKRKKIRRRKKLASAATEA